MAYITKADLSSHIYTANIDEITQGDDTLVTRAIKAGISEAKSYMSRYDLTRLFADTPDPEDENLKMKVQDIVCWHLIKLAVPNIDTTMMREAYDDALGWLEKIMKGHMSPAGWPYHDTTTDPAPPRGNEIYSTSNPKRSQHY